MSSREPLPVWDPGLQNERTKLSWQRTVLSLTACSLVVARFVATRSWVAGVAIALVALVAGGGLGVHVARRYGRAQRALHDETVLPDGRAHLVVVGLLGLIALGGLALVLWPLR